MTLAQVASATKITPTSLSLLERDRRTPSRELLFRLAELFHVSAQFIETGQESPEQAAAAGMLATWPETLYSVSNHAAIGLLLIDRRKITAPNEGVQAAIDRARSLPHLCAFLEWTETVGATLTQDINQTTINAILKQCWTSAPRSPQLWIDLGKNKQISQIHSGREQSGHTYTTAVGCLTTHQPEDMESFLDCDLKWSFELHAILTHGLGRPRPSVDAFRKSFLREAFVSAAFSDVFWAISQLWQHSRIEAWFSFLNLPEDFFLPLAAMAKHAVSPQAFESTGRRLIDETKIEDREILLAALPDLYVREEDYRLKYGELLTALSTPGVFWGGFSIDDRTTVAAHRRIRRQWRAQFCLDLIFRRGSLPSQEKTTAFLEEEAPAHSFPDEGQMVQDSPLASRTNERSPRKKEAANRRRRQGKKTKDSPESQE